MKTDLPPISPKQSSFNWRMVLWILLLWVFGASLLRGIAAEPAPRNIAYTQFKNSIRQGQVPEITHAWG